MKGDKGGPPFAAQQLVTTTANNYYYYYYFTIIILNKDRELRSCCSFSKTSESNKELSNTLSSSNQAGPENGDTKQKAKRENIL